MYRRAGMRGLTRSTFRSAALALLLVTPLPALGQSATQPRDRASTDSVAVEDHPGFVAFATDDLLADNELKVHISIKDAMLRMVAAATRESEPDLANMIRDLRAIEVVVYEIEGSQERGHVRSTISKTSSRLKRAGWEPAIDIRLEDSGGFLYFRFLDGDHPVGLAGIFLDGDEAVFINIVGMVDPALLGRLAARFNISLLDELDAALPKTPGQRR